MQSRMKLCVELRKTRFEHGEMTQAALAQLVGVSRQTVIAIERGDYRPSVELALRIAAVFAVPLEAVFHLQPDDAGGSS
jgi:putative transcriptional regulator